MGIKDRLKKSIGNFRDNLQQQRDVKIAKREALKLFTMKDLKRFCDEAGIGHPPRYSTNIAGERVKNKMDKRQYTDYIIKKESLEFIERFATKHKISVPHEVFERPTRVSREKKGITTQPTTKEEPQTQETGENDTNLEELLNYIKHEFQRDIELIKVRNEHDFNNHLYLALLRKFEGTMEVRNKSELLKRGDILVGEKYLLELKCAKRNPSTTLSYGLSEIMDYQNLGYQKPIMVILDLYNSPQVDEYVSKYKSQGAYVIKLRGNGY